ncbi:Uncharacterised protein [Candidatus Gugararchaeum adminiculabundum]|nr:Uncharacterised protein [Candidatus Gugararchaeum adminiculabundum]
MFRRQKVLLYLMFALNRRGKKITKTYLDKLLFVLRKETNIGDFVKFYNFFPYNYGPFSNQFYFDLADLYSHAYLADEFEVKLPAKEVEDFLNAEEKQLANKIIEKYGDYSTDQIKDYVYSTYPEYAQKSLLKAQKEQEGKPGIFSIGYEKKDIDLFLDLLVQNGIDTLVDVRANAFSMNFSFTKSKLVNYLEKVGIEYLHVPELGISGEFRKGLDSDADYVKLFEFYQSSILPKQAKKVEEVYELGRKKRIALLCFEQDKGHCHRGVLSKELERCYGVQVTHL